MNVKIQCYIKFNINVCVCVCVCAYLDKQNTLYIFEAMWEFFFIYIYIYVYFGRISSLIHISLNIIDIFCLHIFLLILLYCCIDLIIL